MTILFVYSVAVFIINDVSLHIFFYYYSSARVIFNQEH